jgi:hypothetical protein
MVKKTQRKRSTSRKRSRRTAPLPEKQWDMPAGFHSDKSDVACNYQSKINAKVPNAKCQMKRIPAKETLEMSKDNWTKSRATLLITAFLIPGAAPLPTAETSSPQDQDQVEVIPASRTATSTEPLRGMAPPPVSLAPRRKIKRIRLNPNVLVSLAPAPRDPVLQSSVSRPRRTSRRAETPVRGKNLEGIGDGFKGPQGAFLVHGAPPDTSGAVGDTQIRSVR